MIREHATLRLSEKKSAKKSKSNSRFYCCSTFVTDYPHVALFYVVSGGFVDICVEYWVRED
jgi:hypothetical protein